MSLIRILLGFILAPLATPPVFLAVWLATGILDFGDIGGFFLLIGIFAYSAAIIFGVPLVLASRRKHSNAVVFTATGAIAGLFTATALELFLFSWRTHWAQFCLLCVLSGSLSGLAFWVVSFWRPLAEENQN